jgi:two-component system, sensor histidine kinase and response regulator
MNELKLLVVDDEPGMRLGVERTLRGWHFQLAGFDDEVSFQVRMAGTGREALDLIAAELPDILVLDHKLPDIQGLDLLVDLTREKPEMLIVMVTAYASLEVAISATRNGAFDFLAKPFTPEELRNTIGKAARHIFLHRKAQKLAEERRQVRFQFISVLAHELKSPIAAVEGYLRIMEKHMLGEKIEKYDTMVHRSIRRLHGMQKMILDLLDLTHIESGKKQRELDSVDLVEVARESIDGVMPDAGDRGINIRLHAPETVSLAADRGEMEIIFNNFMTNAVKYNRDGGSVSVTLQPEEQGVTLIFADTGIGIGEEDQKRLFKEFVRIKNDKTRDILGSGLGLSIVKKLITFYNGTIKINSQPDQGTTFTVHLENSRESSESGK